MKAHEELDLMIWRCFKFERFDDDCLLFESFVRSNIFGVDMDAAATMYIRLLQFWKLFSFAKVFPVFRWMRQERCAMSVTCRNPLRNHHRCSRSHEPCGQGSGSFRLPCLSRATVNAASDWSEAKKNDKQLGAREVCEIVDIINIYIYHHLYILSESRLTGSYCFVLFHDVLFSWHDLHQILQNMCRMHFVIGCYMSSIWFYLYHHEWASVGCHARRLLEVFWSPMHDYECMFLSYASEYEPIPQQQFMSTSFSLSRWIRWIHRIHSRSPGEGTPRSFGSFACYGSFGSYE